MLGRQHPDSARSGREDHRRLGHDLPAQTYGMGAPGVCFEPGAGTDGHLRGEPLPTVADLRRYQQEAKEVRDFQAVEIELYIRTV